MIQYLHISAQKQSNMEQSSDKVWYAMRATYGRNISAKHYADSIGIITYIPMHYIVKRLGGGKAQRKYVPVIRDLIFVYATKDEVKNLKRVIPYLQYITRPLNNRNIPIIVPEQEMRKFIDVTLSENRELIYLQPNELNIGKGTKVRVHGGELDGYEGYFIKIKGKRNKRVVISFDSVIAVAIEVNPDFIEVIKS